MEHIIYGIFGLVAGSAYILYVQKSAPNNTERLFSIGLIIAAAIYILFATVWGDMKWVGIELVGVLIYSVFIFLGIKHHAAWIGVGWMLHPAWDVGVHLIGWGKGIAPECYAVACFTFDLLVAGWIFYEIWKKRMA